MKHEGQVFAGGLLFSFAQEAASMLQSRWNRPLRLDDDILPTRLFTHRAEVEELNMQHLRELRGEEAVFDAVDTLQTSARGKAAEALAKMLNDAVPVKRRLVLKKGAQVILVRNLNQEEGLVNGARGVVVDFYGQSKHPRVRFASGPELVIRPELWPARIGGRTIGVRKQLPLELAFALSVHRSQGMTLEAVEMSLGRVFEYGQCYVALSRAKSLEGLCLLDRFDSRVVRAHPKVKEFYEAMGARKPGAIRDADLTSPPRAARKRAAPPSTGSPLTRVEGRMNAHSPSRRAPRKKERQDESERSRSPPVARALTWDGL